MEKSIEKAVVSAFILTLIGTIVNLVTYFTMQDMFLATTLSGGEWTGKMGFGLLLNHTFPMSLAGSEMSGQIWLEPDIISFITPLVIFFLVVFLGLEIQRRKSIS